MAKKKQGQYEKYWELFGAFVFCTETYSETIAKVEFFNENQHIVKKIPQSATPLNAVLIKFARRLFHATPKYCKTQFDYLKSLVNEFDRFSGYIQDAFGLYNADGVIDHILAMYKDFLPMRFFKMFPENGNVEYTADRAVTLFPYKNEEYQNCVESLKKWQQNNSDSVKCLHAFLIDGLPDNDSKAIEEFIQNAYRRKNHMDYSFLWEGKDICSMRSESQNNDTLVPDVESSVNFDTTQNLYIEGDNLRVLKTLLPAYKGKVKMIYIDPPYNTGHKFIYKDNFNSDYEIFDRFLFTREKQVRAEA